MSEQWARLPGNALHLDATVHLGPLNVGGSAGQKYQVGGSPEIFIVKLQGNPQGTRVLFNEYVSGRLGELIGVPFGEHALVTVPDSLLPSLGGGNRMGIPGTQFGTTYFPNAQSDLAQLYLARNFAEFPSVAVFDALIARRNGRQYLVYPSSQEANAPRDTGAVFDQGYAFTGAPGWTLEGLRGDRSCRVEDDHLGLKPRFGTIAAYEPFLHCVEAMTAEVIRELVNEAPLAEWGVSRDEADALIEWLHMRRTLVRDAIVQHLR